MQLQLSTWQEVEDYLARNQTIILPTDTLMNLCSKLDDR